MIAELAELVKNKILRVKLHLVACVINFFDVALGSRSAHNVARVAHPFVEPVKSFLRHSGWQNSNATRTHDSTDRHSTAGVVAR